MSRATALMPIFERSCHARAPEAFFEVERRSLVRPTVEIHSAKCRRCSQASFVHQVCYWVLAWLVVLALSLTGLGVWSAGLEPVAFSSRSSGDAVSIGTDRETSYAP